MLALVRVDAQTGSMPSTWDTRIDLKSVALNAEKDCVVLVTDHDAFDYEAIAKHSKILVDTRGRYPKPAGNIVKA
jgi:UDP-N-acetyl-D-glucosamine dehydrogenase